MESGLSDDCAWRVSAYFEESDKLPSLEISKELSREDPNEYLPEIGEALIEMGVVLMKYRINATEDDDEQQELPFAKPQEQTGMYL